MKNDEIWCNNCRYDKLYKNYKYDCKRKYIMFYCWKKEGLIKKLERILYKIKESIGL